MISHFLRLEWKQYFRSSYWETSIALKIILGFFALILIAYLLLLGTFSFEIIKEVAPGRQPLDVVNSYLLYIIATDLIFRYMMQKLPIMNIKPMLILPIKKSKLVHFVLRKSAFSFYNVLPLFFYIPFTIRLVGNGYDAANAWGWFLGVFLITQSINFLNFLINKNNIAFWSAVVIVGGLMLAQKFDVFDITIYSQAAFDFLYNEPLLSLFGFPLLIMLYYLNYKQLYGKVYLDAAVSAKTKEANSADLSWADRFGDVAPFIKNDIRLIWRNKRPKTVFLMSFLFVAYALIFFTQEVYEQKMPAFLVFASVFTTGGFALNFGQFIPAWDSSYYKMLMSQNIKYRLFLESKWYLSRDDLRPIYIEYSLYLFRN